MKKTRIAFGLLGIVLALTGCGAENAEAAPLNLWPWFFGLLGLAVLALAGYQTYCYMIYLRKARTRRRKNTHGVEPLTVILYVAAVILLLLAIITGTFGAATTEPTEPETPTDIPTEAPTLPTDVVGWVDDDSGRYYMMEDGTFAKGWMEMDGRLFYFRNNGMTLSGWHEVEGIRRYFRADGSMARGLEVIEGKTCFFTASGAQVEVVSPAYPLHESYTPNLVDLSVAYATFDVQIDASMEDALIAMLDACNDYLSAQYGDDAARCCVTYGYLDPEDLDEGSKPTSEHLLGLAVDIVDTDSWSSAASEPAQRWLVEHCWDYGFILRYPEGKLDATGVDPQSGHYRYVGLELAQELKAGNLTLEEYLKPLN